MPKKFLKPPPSITISDSHKKNSVSAVFVRPMKVCSVLDCGYLMSKLVILYEPE